MSNMLQDINRLKWIVRILLFLTAFNFGYTIGIIIKSIFF